MPILCGHQNIIKIKTNETTLQKNKRKHHFCRFLYFCCFTIISSIFWKKKPNRTWKTLSDTNTKLEMIFLFFLFGFLLSQNLNLKHSQMEMVVFSVLSFSWKTHVCIKWGKKLIVIFGLMLMLMCRLLFDIANNWCKLSPKRKWRKTKTKNIEGNLCLFLWSFVFFSLFRKRKFDCMRMIWSFMQVSFKFYRFFIIFCILANFPG